MKLILYVKQEVPLLQELEDKKELSEESEDEELQLEEFPMLKTLDPKDWKVFNIWILFSQMQFSIIKPCF